MGIMVMFVISLVASVIIVNAAQRIFMKILGANVMFFKAKTKIVIIVLLAFFITACVMHLFGVEVPT